MPNNTKLPEPSRLSFGAENGVIWLVAIVGLSLSLAALLLIRQQLEAHKMLDFEWVAHNRTRALSYGLANNMLAIETVRDHVVATNTVDADEFRVFAQSLLRRYEGIRALMWVPVISEQQRADYEQASARITQRNGHVSLTPADSRADYFPVRYVEPNREGNTPPGFDLGSIPEFRDTFLRAGDQRKMATSGRTIFPDGAGGQEFGFMAASPVFVREHLSTTSPQAENKELLGFAVGFFRFSNLVNNAVSLLEPRGVEILVVDESVPKEQQFLNFYPSRLAPKEVGEEDYLAWWRDPSEPKVEERIQIADRMLTIVCGRTSMFRSAEAFRDGPWVVLVAGLLFTMLLSFYLARIRENIRQRSLMEQQLAEREELFRQMTETVDEAFWATTKNGENLLYLSPNFEKTLGISAKNGNPSLLNMVYEKDREKLADALRALGRDGNDIEVTHRIQRADGVLRWVRTRGFPVRDDRLKVRRLVGFSEDITERKLADEALRISEAKLRDLFQQSPDLIMTVDHDGKILLMNRSVPAFPADQAVGRNSLTLMPEDLRHWFRRALKKVFAKGVSRQFRYSTEAGIYWEGRIVPIHDEGGPVTAAMVIASDVTEKRNLETQALRNARLASIGVLAAGVAHEINNPNNAIQFNASLVSRAWQDVTPILREYLEENGDFAVGGLPYSEAHESFSKMLAEISKNSDRIRLIVQNLKHMSRQDAGELSENVDIGKVLEATSMVLHNQIQKYTDNCHLEVPDSLPQVKGNSQQLEQVFINLLLNALQALTARTEGVYIHVDHQRDDNMLCVEIRDEGRGISERDLGRLTEPFFTTRTDAGGTGLGLSISRSIVEKHGGSMEFESNSGTGTSVTIRLPAMHHS